MLAHEGVNLVLGGRSELGADVLVVGSRGLGGFRRALIGSVSDSVVRHAHCPVLVVREKEARSDPEDPGEQQSRVPGKRPAS